MSNDVASYASLCGGRYMCATELCFLCLGISLPFRNWGISLDCILSPGKKNCIGLWNGCWKWVYSKLWLKLRKYGDALSTVADLLPILHFPFKITALWEAVEQVIVSSK